ncbi:MAG: hypothetical protein WD118_02125 [Phycisphaeraceae bacterium]
MSADKACMGDAAILVLLLLAALGYVLVTCVLGTLASRVKYACQRHDLVVEARQRRQRYLDRLNDDGPGNDGEILV